MLKFGDIGIIVDNVYKIPHIIIEYHSCDCEYCNCDDKVYKCSVCKYKSTDEDDFFYKDGISCPKCKRELLSNDDVDNMVAYKQNIYK